MKTKILSSILLIYSLFLSSCIQHCGGFPQELEGWVPYHKGDMIRFQSDSDQINFQIDTVSITKPYFDEVQFENGCYSEYYFSTDRNNLPLFSGHCGYSNHVVINCNLSFKKSNVNSFIFSFYPNKSILNYGLNNFDTISYSLKNSILTDVIAIEMTKPNDNMDVNKIFVHKGKGLVGFIKNGREYKLVE